MILDCVQNRLRLARTGQQRKQRERFVRLVSIFACQTIHRLRDDTGLDASLGYGSQSFGVGSFRYAHVCIRSIKVKTSQSARCGGANFSRVVGKRHEHRSEHRFVVYSAQTHDCR